MSTNADYPIRFVAEIKVNAWLSPGQNLHRLQRKNGLAVAPHAQALERPFPIIPEESRKNNPLRAARLTRRGFLPLGCPERYVAPVAVLEGAPAIAVHHEHYRLHLRRRQLQLDFNALVVPDPTADLDISGVQHEVGIKPALLLIVPHGVQQLGAPVGLADGDHRNVLRQQRHVPLGHVEDRIPSHYFSWHGVDVQQRRHALAHVFNGVVERESHGGFPDLLQRPGVLRAQDAGKDDGRVHADIQNVQHALVQHRLVLPLLLSRLVDLHLAAGH
eukprot:scaffold7340_cov266-Pinguiococcus_pyrenoidosus.AAC.88